MIKNQDKTLTRHELRIINYAAANLDQSVDSSEKGFSDKFVFKQEAFALGCIFIEILVTGF